MIVVVPREVASGERRVALVPQEAGRLVKSGLEVVVEKGAGERSFFPDEEYESAGARIGGSAEEVCSTADVILKVQGPVSNGPSGNAHEADLFREGATLISFLFPLANLETVRRLAERRITSFAMDLMPRITRAQSMDALSAMSSIAGYRAVLIAADLLPRFFPMLMTAAGTITPARVLVLGAGVAGLQAIATARRLGAAVSAFDIRPAVREQVESLGARFVEIAAETSDAEDAGGYAKEQTKDTQERVRQGLSGHVAKSDVVITTALVPGKRAPLLLTGDMVREMRPGSVVVDLAAEQGGNCEWTEAGKDLVRDGVTISGPLDLPSNVAVHASSMYSKNISSYLLHLVQDGQLAIDTGDELTSGPMVTRDGEVVHAATMEALDAERVSGES